jgi:hypothetical protein
MSKSVRKGQDPLQPDNLFLTADAVPNTFGNVTTKESVRQLNSFNPKEFSYLTNPTPYDDQTMLGVMNAQNQPIPTQVGRGLTQFGANFASGFGQGLANLVDVTSWGNDNYQSSLFGLSTKDMQDWATGVAQRNKIERVDEGKFNPGSFGWWMEQVGSAGTGVGMGIFALAETAAIEYATGGLGTGAAISRLGRLFNSIGKTRGTQALVETVNTVRDMRSAATVYGVLSRANESRMEAMMSYDEIYNTMSQQKNSDGTPKYTEQQLKEYAGEGARRTFLGNLALMPLDILAFRTMVYNPISGAGTGLVEKALGGIGNKYLRKGLQYGTGAFLEGTEEGFQFVASQEGKHYAQVLGGNDDGTSFTERLGKTVQQDEFWNNFAGGVIGSPIIGGVMNLTNKAISGNRTAKLNSIHSDYVKNIAAMDDAISKKIVTLQEQGKTKEADILRRQYRANKALSALHLDAMTDKNTAFESHINFLEGVLEEVNNGKLDALGDLGFSNPTQEQVEYIKTNFQDSINDARDLQSIYNNVSGKHKRNFVPEVAMDYFQLKKLVDAQGDVLKNIGLQQAKLHQFGELTTYGKEQYNAEYELSSLMAEQARLTDTFREATDEFDKRVYEDLLDANKAKITKLKTRLDEISKEDSYTAEQRKLDMDVLNSALRDAEYSAAMYDKVRLENEIATKRKEIANWSNPAYLKEKTKKAVAKARTEEQAETLANTNGQEAVDPEIAQAVASKVASVKAEEVKPTAETSFSNSNLFAEDNEHINNLTTAVPLTQSTDPENPNVPAGTQAFLLAPAEFDFDNSAPEAKAKIIAGVKGLVERLEGKPDFEKLVRHVIRVQGEKVADEIFNVMKYGWEANGYEPENYQAIYDKVFGDPMEALLLGSKQLTAKQVAKTTNEVVDVVVAKQQKPEGFDNDGQPHYKYTGVVTNESSPKMAFTTRLSQLIQSTDDDGNTIVSHEYTEDELNHGDYVESLQLLDPDKFTEGTEMEIKVPLNFMDIKIPVYNEDGSKGKSVTFGEYVAANNLSPNSQEYKDKLPMIIYKKGSNDKGVAFVHDIGWYHPLRFHQEFKDSMEKAIASTREIRDAVIAGNGEVVITSKRQTTFAGLKTKQGTDVTLREANPQTKLTVAKADGLYIGKDKNDRVYPNDDSVLMNDPAKKPFMVDAIYDVRRYGTKDGKESFMAFPVIKPKLDDISKATVLQAINIYANRANQDAAIRSQHDKIVASIKETMGLDILSSDPKSGLEAYLQHFIHTFNTEKATTNAHVEQQAKAKLNPGTPYIAFIAGGNIVFGRAGQPAFVNKAGQPVGSFYINPNSSTGSAAALSNLKKPDMIGWYEQNLNLRNLRANKPVVTIDANLNTAVAANSYNDFLLDRLRTNIKSANIGTAEQPNYVTNVQPVITYELKSKLATEQPTNEELAAQYIDPETGQPYTDITDTEKGREFVDKVMKGEATTNEAEELARQFLEQAQKDLGSDFGVAKRNQSLLAPMELSEEDRKNITGSINRILGLTPDQQFDIVDFMYNQITTLINLDVKQATKAEVDKYVRQTFDEVVKPQLEYYKNMVAQGEALLAAKPELKNTGIPDSLNDYRYRIAKIGFVEQSFDVLKEEAYNRVAKYTGITENKLETEEKNDEQPSEKNPDNTVEENPNQKEKDFWTDILQESPELKLSYSMRRFFGQIRQYDKGQPVKGFLGLPKYVGASEVTRTLMMALADVPSDFETMLNKLEERKESVPWMQEAINKLKGATQQQKAQFVTVMSNTSLRMRFMMISFNRKTNSYTTKVWDTHQSGVADTVRKEWQSAFAASDLVIINDEGTHTLNKEKAKHLINTFERWTGRVLEVVPFDLNEYRPIVDRVKIGAKSAFNPAANIKAWLDERLKLPTDRVKFSMKGQTFQITKTDGEFGISFLESANTFSDKDSLKSQVSDWLGEFGITLTDETLDELLTKGLYHNYAQRKPDELFEDKIAGEGAKETNGLFGILANSLRVLVQKDGEVNFTEEDSSPLDNTVVKSLANLEAKYNTVSTPFGFRDNGKSFFALTAPKFITDRVRDLKNPDSVILNQLLSVSFSNPSLWLQLMKDERFREKFGVSHIGANAFKELGKTLYKDNAITNLPELDHELTKLGMFWDTTQGEVTENYPGTSISMRMATMFSPTMSDKHLMTLIKTAVLNLNNTHLNDGTSISDDVVKAIYEQTVKPELGRMIKFWQNGGNTNISGYNKGAGLFLLMPQLNNIEIAPGLKLIHAIEHTANSYSINTIEDNEDLMKQVNQIIRSYVDTLVEEKLNVWSKNGLVERDANNTIIKMNFFDKKYTDPNRFRGSVAEVAKMAAMDFVINSVIANANSFMALAGDPAIYYKSNSVDYVAQAKDTFVNVGKRLANQIAPGTPLSNSENEKYIQIFLDDRKSLAEIPYLKFVTRINDGNEITDAEIETLRTGTKDEAKAIAAKYPVSAGYFSIEGSDAQEYTTWKEHLDVLTKLGKTPDSLVDITPEDITEAREIFSSEKSLDKLSDRQLQLIGKVMQPIKPVYTGQIFDAEQDVMRTMYIKSSSFPLIPQLTSGFEIDKLRVAMEKMEAAKKQNVRASYQTANKVGSLNNPVKIWNKDGAIDEEALKNMEASSMILDRKNFRIQQEIPFKSGKTGEDKITLGTQLMKLLFGDEIMNESGFTFNGETYTGKELHKKYNELFITLIKEKKNQLYSELGLDSNGTPVDAKKSTERLQQLLKDEAVKRGYPLQDIEGLTLTPDGQFNLPLWASSNSNRYESMLNAIVTNRIIRMKFPGNSFVVGSEEGFRKQDNFEGVDTSRIIWTSSWNGKSLQGAYFNNGQLKKAQVLISSKFKTPDGKLLDLFERADVGYKYITKNDNGGFSLKEDMFDKELLAMITFRIPTSGHQSASQVEIVGFLPPEVGDLMIVPRNFTKQKGLDFDVDKENAYNLWSHMNDDGSYEVLQEKHRNKILAEADRYLKGELSSDAFGRMTAAIFGDDVTYTKEDIEGDKGLMKLNSKITEKILQNELIKINHSVMGSNKASVQSKINKTLNTDFAEDQANKIEAMSSTADQTYWTALSDEYQKQKMMMGASGKIGTGAYSLDVVFHSLVQQSAIGGQPLQLVETVGEGDEKQVRPKVWKFGSVVSDGQLGKSVTLDGGRSISEVMSERQNVAVDNEKLQVMGRVNLNDITMDVDKVMNLLGFDKGDGGNSISFMFLSQPVIKEFVNRLKNASSTMAEFEADKEGKVVEDLLKIYEGDEQVVVDDEYWKVMSAQMTNSNFEKSILDNGADGKFQAAVLRRFIEMRKYGIAIRSIQTTINTDSKGLGKSFFDVIEKRNSLNKLGAASNGLVTGASALIGDFVEVATITNTQIQDLKELGYVDIGDYMVKPTTLSGAFNIIGVSTAYNLWNRYFPYNAGVTERAFREILSIIAPDGISDTATIENKQEIFREMKKYFATFLSTNFGDNASDINDERRRLFIDSDTNTSLAKYLRNLRELPGNEIVNTYIKTNKLINRFEFDIKKDGMPSLIKYTNAAGEEFDEQYLYESLTTLLEWRGTTGSVALPDLNGKPYTLDKLAQDLIAYSYYGNAIQEAIQFTKYVPISYLNTVGFSKNMRNIGLHLRDNNHILGMNVGGTENSAHLVGEFTMQFVQHNPERVREKHIEKNLDKLIKKSPDGTFVFKDERRPTFVSVYNTDVPKGEKKFKLYWFDGAKYVQIPVLGVFGMDEYQKGKYIGQSLVNGKVKIKAKPQEAINKSDYKVEGVPELNLTSGDSYEALSMLSKSGGTYSLLSEHLMPFVAGIKYKIVEELDANGKYFPEENLILINKIRLDSADNFAQTLNHELVHALTVNQVTPYITTNSEGMAELTRTDTPVHIENLVRLYNNLRIGLDNNKLKEIQNKARVTGKLTRQELDKYGFTDIYEFMSMALTDPNFQQILGRIEYKDTGMSFLDKFKEIIARVLQTIGVEFSDNFTVAHAISTIFEVIEKENPKIDFNPYGYFQENLPDGDMPGDGLIDGDEVGMLQPENKDELLDLAKAALITHMSNEFYLNAMLTDIEGGLREAASQMNLSDDHRRIAINLYGKEFTDIAVKLFPNENYQTKGVDNYIDKLDSNQTEC